MTLGAHPASFPLGAGTALLTLFLEKLGPSTDQHPCHMPGTRDAVSGLELQSPLTSSPRDISP